MAARQARLTGLVIALYFDSLLFLVKSIIALEEKSFGWCFQVRVWIAHIAEVVVVVGILVSGVAEAVVVKAIGVMVGEVAAIGVCCLVKSIETIIVTTTTTMGK